jgi:putative FmdB family regulatory protein
MPTYDYACDAHGEFSAMRPMAQYREPQPCPTCGVPAPRVVSVPAMSFMDGSVRAAHAVNERSAHAPSNSADYKARHGAGCGCCGGAGKRSSAATAADGSKSFPSKRPWMISH